MMAFLAKRRPVFANDKDFVHHSYNIKVFRSLPLDKAAQEGAPETELDIYTHIQHHEHLFPFEGRAPVEYYTILLVCFGRFMHQNAVWKWAKKNRLDSLFAHPRSVFAFASGNATFCHDMQQKVAGLVTFKALVPHLGQKHALVLYYNDTLPTNKRELKLDPYTCGWAAHHWFCFELPPGAATKQ